MACEHEHLGIHIHLNRHLASFWIIHYVYMMHITYSTSGFFRWCSVCQIDAKPALMTGEQGCLKAHDFNAQGISSMV